MRIKYIPKGNRMIIQPIEKKEETKVGSLIAPDMADHLASGVVIAIGKGEYAKDTGLLIPTETLVGEIVAYRKDAAHIPLLNGQILMREPDLECGLEEEED